MRCHSARFDAARFLWRPCCFTLCVLKMATLAAVPAARRAPWASRLQERQAAAEHAVAALLAVCEEPDAQATLEVRAVC